MRWCIYTVGNYCVIISFRLCNLFFLLFIFSSFYLSLYYFLMPSNPPFWCRWYEASNFHNHIMIIFYLILYFFNLLYWHYALTYFICIRVCYFNPFETCDYTFVSPLNSNYCQQQEKTISNKCFFQYYMMYSTSHPHHIHRLEYSSTHCCVTCL